MEIKLNNLEKAQQLLKSTESDESYESTMSDIGLEDHVLNAIKSNLCYTIRVKYEFGEVVVISTLPSNVKVVRFSNYTADDYGDFCKKVLSIDMEERENCSRSLVIEGIKTRVYAIMKPYSENPLVTISTTKIPPSHLDKVTISDDAFSKIMHSNFIIVGPSGSGKTYLMNYLLNKFIGKKEQICIIEEFMELIPPNELCTCLTCPPPKSNEKSKLRFITEQSNLMRLDAIYLGEIKGAEAWPFLINLASGTRGACTMHGDTAPDALSRLRALCQLETENAEAINNFIAKNIHHVIVMGDKRIDAIFKLTGTHNKGIFAMEEVNS